MLDHWVRIVAAVGILTFGLRGVLPGVDLPGWVPMLGLVLLVLVVHGVDSLAATARHPSHLGRVFYTHLRDAFSSADRPDRGDHRPLSA
jgi:hypothetical protein